MRRWFRAIWQRLQSALRAHVSPRKIGTAVGIGLFVGGLPTYGLHLPMCYAVARWLKLNHAVTYIAANISNPLFAPALIASQVALGEWVRHGGWVFARSEGSVWDLAGSTPDLFLSYLLGSILSSVILGLTGGTTTWGLLELRARRRAARGPGASNGGKGRDPPRRHGGAEP